VRKKPFIPPRIPNPKHAAEDRARLLRWLFWTAVILPVSFALLVYGYSDQAPAPLRSITITLDSQFGYPLWNFLNPAAPR
jgi:hypothetical protein